MTCRLSKIILIFFFVLACVCEGLTVRSKGLALAQKNTNGMDFPLTDKKTGKSTKISALPRCFKGTVSSDF
jgi:hypothetical protein